MRSKLLILGICLIFIVGCEKGEREDFFDLKGNKICELEFKLNGENGTIVVYYENWNKKAAITIINGDPKREIEWYENGKKRIEREYTESFSDWKEVTWYENGNKESEKEIKDRTDHGKEIWWYENGQKRCERKYFKGQPQGRWIFWDENGQLGSIMEFKNGKLHGKSIDWDKNGNITRESIFKDGKMISDKYPQKNKNKKK